MFTLDQPATTNSQQPASKAQFLTAYWRSKENLSIPGATQENLKPIFLHSKS